MSIIKASDRFKDFASKAEEYLLQNDAGKVEKANISLHIGANKDSAVGQDSGYRVTGSARYSNPDYIEIPEKIFADEMVSNFDAKMPTMKFVNRVSDKAAEWISKAINKKMENGETFDNAKKSVYDSIDLVGYKDPKTQEYVAEPCIKGVNDADISSVQVPFWNITYLNKIYKQPMLQGYAKRMVSEIGVPNIWADFVSMWTETFEGYARFQNVAKTTGQHNINEAGKVRTHQMISNFVNIVADFESSVSDGIYAGLNGNPLTSRVIGDNEKYTRHVLETMHNALIYFGDSGAGFDGLAQQTSEITWNSAPFSYILGDTSNSTKGIAMVEAFRKTLSGWLEDLNFMPTKAVINMSPAMFKCLTTAINSAVFSPKSPMEILTNNHIDSRFNESTPLNNFRLAQTNFEINVDPMLSPNTPFNNYNTDLMFVTFTEFKSDMEPTGLKDVVLAPTAISSMILPYYYGNTRDGSGKTMLKRIGSILSPINGAVKCIRGIGVNPSYTPTT